MVIKLCTLHHSAFMWMHIFNSRSAEKHKTIEIKYACKKVLYKSSRTIFNQIGISEYQPIGFSNDYRPDHRYVNSKEAVHLRYCQLF